ncbi:MAG: hypothetical protein NWP81_03485, partial [Burkholderiaceae bacterium]|nr:hypothetical protein [Burkholderiaceae bacterium]
SAVTSSMTADFSLRLRLKVNSFNMPASPGGVQATHCSDQLFLEISIHLQRDRHLRWRIIKQQGWLPSTRHTNGLGWLQWLCFCKPYTGPTTCTASPVTWADSGIFSLRLR